MIGDWVTDEYWESFKTPVKVESINDKGINLEIKDDGNYAECANTWIAPEYFTCDKVYGIPLSPEVMEKIESISKNENRGSRYGFLDGYYNIDRDTGLVAIFEDDGLLYIYTYEYSHEQFQLVCTFKYLHQLQQLIRLFTSKEIVVKWD
jgi:hypothetical protein